MVFIPAPVTVTVHTAVYAPSNVVTVTLASPLPSAISLPPDTVTTLWLSEDHNTPLLEALAGDTVAHKEATSPTVMVNEFLFNVTPVTG